METIENFQNIDYPVSDSPAYDMPQCCMIVVHGRCIRSMTHFSKYCVQHTFGQYHASNKGCKYGISNNADDSEAKMSDFTQCGKSVLVKGSIYCPQHVSMTPQDEEMKRCTRILTRGVSKGLECGQIVVRDELSMCKIHLHRYLSDNQSAPHQGLRFGEMERDMGLAHGGLKLGEMERDEIKIKPQEDTVDLPFAQTLLAHETEMLPLNYVIHQTTDTTSQLEAEEHKLLNQMTDLFEKIIASKRAELKAQVQPAPVTNPISSFGAYQKDFELIKDRVMATVDAIKPKDMHDD